MNIFTKDITGLVLAGGQGRRMGGVDKGLEHLAGEPLVAHVIRRLRPQTGALLVSANRNLDSYRQLGADEVLQDQIDGFPGPLAGIHAGLARCRTPYLVTAPCDAPLLPPDLVERLSDALQANASDVAVAVSREQDHQRRQPVFMLVRSTLLDHLDAALRNGCRKVDDWLSALNPAEARFDDADAFININTLQDRDQLALRVDQSPRS